MIGNIFASNLPAQRNLCRWFSFFYNTIRFDIPMTLVNWKASSILSLVVLALLFSLSSCGDDDEPTTTRVYGTITMENPEVWPTWADSGEVQVTIFPEFSLDPLAGWGALPDGLFGPDFLGGTYAAGAPYNSQNPPILSYEAGTTEYEYSIELEAGTYSALALGFRHDGVTDASLKTATLGVHWDNESDVSHGVVIQVQAGPSVMTIFDEPAPTAITIEEGEELEINFTADFDFVNQWYQ